MRELARCLKALSDETRLFMLGLAAREGELCVCDFMEVLSITQSKASRHLRTLVNAGLLDDRREGVWVFFRIKEQPAAIPGQVLSALQESIAARLPRDLLAQLGRWQKQKASACKACASPRKASKS